MIVVKCDRCGKSEDMYRVRLNIYTRPVNGKTILQPEPQTPQFNTKVMGAKAELCGDCAKALVEELKKQLTDIEIEVGAS